VIEPVKDAQGNQIGIQVKARTLASTRDIVDLRHWCIQNFKDLEKKLWREFKRLEDKTILRDQVVDFLRQEVGRLRHNLEGDKKPRKSLEDRAFKVVAEADRKNGT
jgi:hypothetical protein